MRAILVVIGFVDFSGNLDLELRFNAAKEHGISDLYLEKPKGIAYISKG